jgi:drug/metabolite transporter (DMT)-like permease
VQLLLFASFTAIFVLFALALATNKLHLLKAIRKKDMAMSAIYGFLNPFAYYMVLFKAYDMLSAQEAVVLNYTWPIALVLLSIPILKQGISWKSVGALFISFFGIIIIVTGGSLKSLGVSDPIGASLALGSSVIWALYWILNLRDSREEISKLLVNFIFGFLYVLIAAIAMDEVRLASLKGMMGAIYIGIIEMGVAFTLWLTALKLATTTAKVSNLIYISPFLSLIFVSVFVGEKIMLASWTGLIFIVAGIVLQQVIKPTPGT